MRILAIRLENLASLAGHHELDFTAPPLADQGLFAITGPTGAGKSTLLDALCLALYGSTPRLRHAPGRDSQLPDVGDASLTTADARTLLRRGCAAGFAEVDFVGRDQRRYRARWAVRRARDRLDGRLQAAEQSLTDLDDQRLLTAQKREFERLLPERLGLSFEQFTRAVLLAQSEFAAFLKADDNARSELLEKLTDTDEYSRISIEAYRRARDAQQVVREIDQRLSGDTPAEAEQRAHLENEAASSERRLADAQAQTSRLRADHQWLAQDRRLNETLGDAQHRLDQARQHDASLAGLRQRAAHLEQLAPERHRFLRLSSLASQNEEQQRHLASTREALRAAEQDHAQATQQRQHADAGLATASGERETAQPRIESAREQAAQLDHQQRTRRDRQLMRQRLITTREEDQQRHATLQATQRQQRDEMAGLETALREQLGDQPDALSARRVLQEAQDRLGQRRLNLQGLQQHWQQWLAGSTRLNERREQYASDERELAQVLERGQRAATELEQLDAAHRQLHMSIERLRAVRSESVIRLRQQLSDEEPCPVCGSLAHPYREAPPDAPAQAQLEATEREEQRQLDAAASAVDTARERHHTLQGQYRAIQARLPQHSSQIDALAADVATQHRQLLDQPEGEALLARSQRHHGEAATAWLDEQRHETERQWRDARQALEALEATQQRLAPLQEALQQRTIELERLASRCEQHDQALAELDAELAPLATRCEQLNRELREALGKHASPGDWQASLEAALEGARQHAQHSQARQQQAASERQRQQQALDHQTQTLESLSQERDELNQRVAAWREAHPDIDDTELEALLAVDDQQHQSLRQRLSEAERERQVADVSLAERRQALVQHRHERFADIAPDALFDTAAQARIAALAERLEKEQARVDEVLASAQQQRDTAVHALHDDDRRRDRQRDLLSELEQARREQHRWGSISDLIGSADGKAFRRIAQAYNLDQLLDHANAHLGSLSKRYRLVRGGSELGILVIDGDMGDEQRSVHSLSGGETFLVSLALALGLASMASGQLRIESLFIDEGFGSLDPQSLALAMEALDGLQAQGRRVGVISHVQEMHERIPLQIRIEPQGNGASRLSIVKAGMG